MAKAAYKSPTIFIACPYSAEFGFKKFKNYLLGHYPGTIIFAETNLQTRHLLDILRSHIKKTDFSVFDVSTWNPNVALELGIADGLNADYYITLNRKHSKNVPSDIQGLQRIEYSVLEKGDGSLHEQLQRYIVRQKTFVGKKLWALLREEERGDALFTFAIRVMCHFRDRSTLRPDKAKSLSKGLHLRAPQRDLVLGILRSHKYIKAKKSDYVLARKVFKPYTST
jgi:hypothetical protein